MVKIKARGLERPAAPLVGEVDGADAVVVLTEDDDAALEGRLLEEAAAMLEVDPVKLAMLIVELRDIGTPVPLVPAVAVMLELEAAVTVLVVELPDVAAELAAAEEEIVDEAATLEEAAEPPERENWPE